MVNKIDLVEILSISQYHSGYFYVFSTFPIEPQMCPVAYKIHYPLGLY